MADSRLQESLALRGLFGFALQLVLRLRGLLLIPIVLRALPAGEVGVLNLRNAFTGWITPLLTLGLNSGSALHTVRLAGPAMRPAILSVLSFSSAFSTLGAVAILLYGLQLAGSGLQEMAGTRFGHHPMTA